MFMGNTETVGSLSPRVRGNLPARCLSVIIRWSIPARAGEPYYCASLAPLFWVYPRACGGTRHSCTVIAVSVGLSPRVRGNPIVSTGVTPPTRSIPARAGEPLSDEWL